MRISKHSGIGGQPRAVERTETANMVPCVRFKPFVRLVFRLASYGPATLGTGGWLDLTRQGLAPCKKRQACLGAHAAEGERAGTALFAQFFDSLWDNRLSPQLGRASLHNLNAAPDVNRVARGRRQ